jgi:chromosome segregation ATPase
MVLAMVLLPLGFAGCESTGDPRQGGIFWSEAKARERLADERAQVQTAQNEATEQRAITSRSRARREALSATVARQRRELTQLGADISSLEAELAGRSEGGEETSAELRALERQRVSLLGSDSQDVAAKEAELVRLRQDVNRLKERYRLLEQTH